MARQPRSVAIAYVWIICSIIFLDTAISTVRHLRALGQPVSLGRYAIVVFWVGLLLFWLWSLLSGWRSKGERTGMRNFPE